MIICYNNSHVRTASEDFVMWLSPESTFVPTYNLPDLDLQSSSKLRCILRIVCWWQRAFVFEPHLQEISNLKRLLEAGLWLAGLWEARSCLLTSIMASRESLYKLFLSFFVHSVFFNSTGYVTYNTDTYKATLYRFLIIMHLLYITYNTYIAT